MKTEYRILINYFYLVFIFIWQSMRMTLFNGFDGVGRIIIFASLIIFLINVISSKTFLTSLFKWKRVNFFWFLWFLYASIHTIFYYDLREIPLISFIGVNLFTPFVVMISIANLPGREISRLLKILQHVLFIAILLLFLFARENEGLLELAQFDPNELSLIIIFFVGITILRYLKKEINLLNFVIWITIPSFYLISLGSRMAFGSFMILLLGLMVTKKNQFSGQTFFKYFFLTVSAIVLTIYVLNFTKVGERLKETTEQSETAIDNSAEGTIFEKYGDRGVYYVIGWELFRKNPIFGIGLRNFINYYPQVNHVEFMVQLSELGLIGFILYSLFNIFVIKGIYGKRKMVLTEQKSIFTFLIFIFIALMFSASVLFLYPSFAVAGIYGLLLFFINKSEYKSAKKFKIQTIEIKV